MSRRLGAALALSLLAAGCGEAPAKSVDADLPALTGRVVDEADLLSPRQEAALTAASAALEREVGPQYVVVTVADLKGRSIEAFGRALGNSWGIGSKEGKDGVLLIVAPSERQARIEVGLGLEVTLSDSFCAKVMKEELVPRFASGDFPDGIAAGSRAIGLRLRAAAKAGRLAA